MPVTPAHDGLARSSHDIDVPAALSRAMTEGWAPSEPSWVDDGSAAAAARHRERLCSALPGAVVVVPSGTPARRTGDQPFPFRASSDFVWLSGCHEPYAVLVMRTDDPTSAVLYRHAGGGRSDDRFWTDRQVGELWTGRRATHAAAAERYGLRCGDRSTLPTTISGALVLRGHDADADRIIAPQHRDAELASTVASLRLVKDGWEVEQLRGAVRSTVAGFEDVRDEWARVLEHGERYADATFLRRARLEGEGVGYSNIVGAGRNAATLHWTANDAAVARDDLVLLDLGVETRSLYTADVTRVLPASGTFSPDQRAVYDVALAMQEAGLAQVASGRRFRAAHEAAMEAAVDGLISLGILRMSKDEALDPERQLYRRYTLCGSGHMLGLDVHDCGSADPDLYPGGLLAEGHVLTVEPGIYLQHDDLTVPPELRGLGIRVEDDLLVTAEGYEMLSAALPRAAADVEAWMASGAGR